MENFSLNNGGIGHIFDQSLFDNIVDDLVEHGISVRENGVPDFVVKALCQGVEVLPARQFKKVGIGRAQDYQTKHAIRGDSICWIEGTSEEGATWLAWCEALRVHINRTLFMGLFSFESHYATYPPGTFYKRHLDAFKGQSNRKLSIIVYLNDDWCSDDGGELVIYSPNQRLPLSRVAPKRGTIVTFLSDVFPHEVLTAKKTRHSVAGWFSVNTSINDNIDPPEWGFIGIFVSTNANIAKLGRKYNRKHN